MAAGDNTRTQAAASSMASGNPSSRRQILDDRGSILLIEGEVGIDVARTLDEQPDRAVGGERVEGHGVGDLGKRQRRRPEPLLVMKTERGPAGGEHRQAGAPLQQRQDIGGRVKNVLEVVQNEQQVTLAQRGQENIPQGSFSDLADVERLGDCGQNECRTADCRQRDEDRSIGEGGFRGGGGGESQSGLADAARSSHRDEAAFRPGHEITECSQFPLAADERR